MDPAIIDGGTVQVSGYGEAAQCKATSLFDSGAMVHCFGPKGVAHDTDFTVLLGS